jgi:hypothetical protein
MNKILDRGEENREFEGTSGAFALCKIIVKRLPRSSQITQSCLQILLAGCAWTFCKAASIVKFIDSDDIFTQPNGTAGIDFPSRHRIKCLVQCWFPPYLPVRLFIGAFCHRLCPFFVSTSPRIAPSAFCRVLVVKVTCGLLFPSAILNARSIAPACGERTAGDH